MSTPHPCDLYHELRTLYDVCNTQFFGNTLPACMLLLRPRKGTFGYFQKACWGQRQDTAGQVPAIALNSTLVHAKGDEEMVSTLLHEMAHLWQECYGEKKPAKPYHNREWAAKMVSMGLMPSSTGQPGGKQVGKHVSEFRLDNGAFAQWYATLAQPCFSWGEFPHLVDAKTQEKKLKYACPQCEAKAWAHDGARLVCGDCRISLVTEAIQLLLGMAEPGMIVSPTGETI